MQDNTEINYDNYEILKDDGNSPTGKPSFPEFGDMFDFYEVVKNFTVEEIVKKQRDFQVLGQYLDYNLYLSSPYHFIGFLRFAYQPFFNKNLSSENTDISIQFNLSIQYKISQYVKNWIEDKVLELGLQNDFELNYTTSLPLFGSIYPNIIQSYDRIKKDNFVTRMNAFMNNQPIPLLLEGETPPPKAEVKEYRERENANAKHTKIIAEFLIEINKPRATQSKALENLSNRTDLKVGKIDKPNIRSNRKQIHDILKSYGLALS